MEKIPSLQSQQFVITMWYESLWSDIQLLLQILYDPLRQWFGRGGVLAGVQLTVNNDMGLEKSSALKLSPKFVDLVLQKKTDILWL